MKTLLPLLALFVSVNLYGQQPYYFPPAGNTTWETVNPQTLGWCQERIDTLSNYLELKDTKGFIILKNGKIALERYYGTFTKDSLWYWASAGKSLTAFLTGKAQEEGYFDINDKTSDYLGVGWTIAPQPKEDLITIRNQLTMTTGLDYNVPDDNCTVDTCLDYLGDAGTFWYYYNAPYRLINNVIESATSINYNQYTTSRVKNPIGMSSGVWVQDVFYSRTRDAARFGLLMLNHAVWNGDTLLHDTNYYNAMINTSQNFNKSYGYLWWLNGKGQYMMPATTLQFNGNLVPDAPDDMYAALGKNDQKIYVCPSLNMVVVRFGNTAGPISLASSSFDSQLWQRIMNLDCTSSVAEDFATKIKIYPNPTANVVNVSIPQATNVAVSLLNIAGQVVLQSNNTTTSTLQLNTVDLPSGMYIITISSAQGIYRQRIVITH